MYCLAFFGFSFRKFISGLYIGTTLLLTIGETQDIFFNPKCFNLILNNNKEIENSHKNFNLLVGMK